MVLCVYQLHSAAINALIVHDGFCVTASDDRQLRVWPMDFTDYLLEVRAVDIVSTNVWWARQLEVRCGYMLQN